jgi:hypothetical protein
VALQGPFSEGAVDVTGGVTAGAAGLAAVLAGVNLYVSGRRELHKWTREALVEALVVFLDTSIKQSGLCSTAASRRSLPDPPIDNLQRAVIAVHDLQTETLTRLRLLAPSRVVIAAEALHRAGHELVYTCFIEPPQATEANKSTLLQMQRARQEFLKSARSTLRLTDTAAINHGQSGGERWHEFRSSARAFTAEHDLEPGG